MLKTKACRHPCILFSFVTKRDFSILLANVLDHFDTAIYGFLAPLLAPLFFPDYDPIVQLILAYSLLLTSLVTRPLGAFLFGNVARFKGPLYGLSYSLIGMALMTMLIGCLPTYADIGWFAPLGLICIRMFKGLFAAGESTIAKLYIMEDKSSSHALQVSHLYQSSTMVGIILASGLATLVISSSYQDLWRICFLFGGLTGVLGIFLRRVSDSKVQDLKTIPFYSRELSGFSCLWKQKETLLKVGVILGFSYLTYAIPFVFMNSFIPLITPISLKTMMELNTCLLVFDMVSIPLFGRLLLRFKPLKIMLTACCILGFTVIPFFQNLSHASLAYVVFVRVWIVGWGVVFLCPMSFWLKELFPAPERYLFVGIGGALGGTIIGRLATPICLWLWSVSHWAFLPALYLSISALLTAWGLLSARRTKEISFKTTSVASS